MRMTPWVHQYTLRDLLDDTFDLFKERAGALLLAGILPYALVVVYTALMRIFVIPGNILQEFTEDAFLNMLQAWEFWVYFLGLSLVSSLAFGAAFIAPCRIAANHALGREIGLRQAFRLMAKPIFGLLVISAFYSLVPMISFFVWFIAMLIMSALTLAVTLIFSSQVLASITGVIVQSVAIILGEVVLVACSVCFLAMPVSLAFEHTGPFTAIGVGFRLAFKNFKPYTISLYAITRIIAIFLPILGGFVGILLGVTGYISPLLNVGVVFVLVGGVGTTAFMGVLACLSVLVYIDGRCRDEALDLQLLGREIGLGDTLEEAMRQSQQARMAAPAYPDYSVRSTSPAPVPSEARAGACAPSGYPDYSATPPPAPANDQAYPDYSAPPPAPAEAQSSPETAAPESAETLMTSGGESGDER